MPSPVFASAPAVAGAVSAPAVVPGDDPQAMVARSPAVTDATRMSARWLENGMTTSFRRASKGSLKRWGRLGCACAGLAVGHMQLEDGSVAVRFDQLESAAVGSCDRCAEGEAETCTPILG